MKKNEKRSTSNNKNANNQIKQEKEKDHISSTNTNQLPKEAIQLNNIDALKEFQKGSDFINSLIHEYLIKRDYVKTLDTFQDEINSKIKIKQYYTTRFSETANETMLDGYFINGKKTEFFKLWNRIIPTHLKHKEIILDKLEFFLQIYFAVYPLLPSVVGDKKNIKDSQLKETKIRMQEFKIYLESKEVEMSKTTEYLAYYALPYVNNPRDHPSYKQIFSPEWIRELKDKLKGCLNVYIPSGKYPLLYDMYLNYASQKDDKKPKNSALNMFLDNLNKNLDYSEPMHQQMQIQSDDNLDNARLLDEFNKLKKKEEATKLTLIESQKKWTNFSLDILGISFELISLIKKLKNGAEVSNDLVDNINNKLGKYELFLKKNAEELDKNNNNSKDRDRDNSELIEVPKNQSKEKTQTSKNKSHNVSNENINNANLNKSLQQAVNNSIHLNISYEPSNQLEYPKIKEDIAKMNAYGYDNPQYYERINFILREIRLRLTRRKYQKLKQVTLYSIVYYDLLALRSKNVKIYHNLINNEKTILETLKLMNALTNENRGRTYLLSKSTMIEDIVNIMFKEETDTEVRQNCLGIIQKFTLRSEPQKKLIELDVIMWIVSVFISDTGNLSDYTLEYGLALVMNLSLRSAGRDKCELVHDKLLKILIHYLHSESIQVRTCINGTMYSLLKRKKIKEEAKKSLLPKLLLSQLENPNEQMKKQIQYILDELNSDVEQEEKFDEEFEDENYGDEEEVYEDDYVKLKLKIIFSMKKIQSQKTKLFFTINILVII